MCAEDCEERTGRGARQKNIRLCKKSSFDRGIDQLHLHVGYLAMTCKDSNKIIVHKSVSARDTSMYGLFLKLAAKSL